MTVSASSGYTAWKVVDMDAGKASSAKKTHKKQLTTSRFSQRDADTAYDLPGKVTAISGERRSANGDSILRIRGMSQMHSSG